VTNAYCMGDTNRCARFLVYHELHNGIPADLRPDQHGRAHDILSCAFYG
jgi:hypothetical protein